MLESGLEHWMICLLLDLLVLHTGQLTKETGIKAAQGNKAFFTHIPVPITLETLYTPYEYPHPLRNGEYPSEPAEEPTEVGNTPSTPGKAWIEQ